MNYGTEALSAQLSSTTDEFLAAIPLDLYTAGEQDTSDPQLSTGGEDVFQVLSSLDLPTLQGIAAMYRIDAEVIETVFPLGARLQYIFMTKKPRYLSFLNRAYEEGTEAFSRKFDLCAQTSGPDDFTCSFAAMRNPLLIEIPLAQAALKICQRPEFIIGAGSFVARSINPN